LDLDLILVFDFDFESAKPAVLISRIVGRRTQAKSFDFDRFSQNKQRVAVRNDGAGAKTSIALAWLAASKGHRQFSVKSKQPRRCFGPWGRLHSFCEEKSHVADELAAGTRHFPCGLVGKLRDHFGVIGVEPFARLSPGPLSRIREPAK
jgi:hypothetical protein